jgi:hypothetical protein
LVVGNAGFAPGAASAHAHTTLGAFALQTRSRAAFSVVFANFADLAFARLAVAARALRQWSAGAEGVGSERTFRAAAGTIVRANFAFDSACLEQRAAAGSIGDVFTDVAAAIGLANATLARRRAGDGTGGAFTG